MTDKQSAGEAQMKRVTGSGFDFFTDDPVVIAVVRKFAELSNENIRLNNELVARYRTLRRDVDQIKRRVCRP